MTSLLALAFSGVGMNAGAQTGHLPDRDIPLKVVNKRGRPVSNVMLHSSLTNKTGVTDRAGLFVFSDMADSDTINMIFPKSGSAQIPVAGLDAVVITMRSSNQYIVNDNHSQVYIIQQDRISPGSLMDVQAILRNTPCKTLAELLNGRVAGLSIDTNGIATMRGASSINFNNQPLVVVDGMALGPFSEANRSVNVLLINSIEIQKDGAGWGSTGAGGVILISTIK